MLVQAHRLHESSMKNPVQKTLFDYAEQQDNRAQILLLNPDDIFACATTDLLEKIKEDRRIERKPAKMHAEPLAEYFSMWANTSPDGGLIVMGMTNDGKIEGCSFLDEKALNDREKTGFTHCQEARYETTRIEAFRENGERDFVLLIRVFYHPTRVVETNSGKVFVRRGDSKTELKTDEEKRQLRIDKGEIQHEQEPSGLEYPDDFEIELLRQWATNVRKGRRLDSAISDEKILEIFHLGKRKNGQFLPNIACALVFAKDPTVGPHCLDQKKKAFLSYTPEASVAPRLFPHAGFSAPAPSLHQG